MKILFITDCFAYKDIGAYRLSHSHLRILKKIVGTDNITVISINGKNKESNEGDINFYTYSNKVGALKNTITLNYYMINNKVTNEILGIIGKHDLIFIDNSVYGKLVRKIKKCNKKIKIISFYHDVKANLAKKWLREQGMKILPVYISTTYNEKLTAKYSDINIVLNEREKKEFIKYYNFDPMYEAPIYIEDKFNENKVVKLNQKDKLKLLFVGANYYPNVNGITWFTSEVMPKLNDVELTIIGKDIDKALDIKDENIKIFGYVDDLSEYYYDTDLVIAPIFKGAGMKVKTAEALMYGKTIAGTDEAFEGYTKDIENCIYKCNTRDEYVNFIDKYKNVKQKYNKNSREVFLKYFSDDAGIQKFKEILLV